MPGLHWLRLGTLLRSVQRRKERLGLIVQFIGTNHALSNQLLGVTGRYRLGAAHSSVQDRLREVWLVCFVVPVLAPAPHIDKHILTECAAPLRGKARYKVTCFGIATIDVEHGRFNHLGNVGAVRTHVGVTAVGGEANLIVDDHMHRAAHVIANQASHVERLCDHSLAGQRRISMEQNRQHLGNAISKRTSPLLPRASASSSNWSNKFQVTGVWAERNAH